MLSVLQNLRPVVKKKRQPAAEKKKLKHAAATRSRALVELSRRIEELLGVVRGLTEVGAEALEKLLAPELEEGETMPDLRLLFRLMGRLLERRLAAAHAADSRRWIEVMTLTTLRLECKELTGELYRQAVETRRVLVASLGSKLCRKIFKLGPRTPRSSVALFLEAETMMHLLRHPGLVLPDLSSGLSVKPRVLAKALEPSVQRLEPLLVRIEEQKIAAEDEAGFTRQAIEEGATICQRVGVALEVLFTLGGKLEHAKRLRSKARRRARAAAARAVPRPRRAPAAEPAAGTPAAEPQGRARAAVVSIADWLKRRTAGRRTAGRRTAERPRRHTSRDRPPRRRADRPRTAPGRRPPGRRPPAAREPLRAGLAKKPGFGTG